ncbi:MAG: hypothetical protein O2816_12000 [Planctomycetota bacterium]|nr:hypothetical protein [Planctomycetota bacterium]
MQRIASVGGGGARPEPVARVCRAPTTSRQGTGGQAASPAAQSVEVPEETVDRRDELVERLRADNRRAGQRDTIGQAPEHQDSQRLLQVREATTDLVSLLATHTPPAEGRLEAALAAQQVRDLREGEARDLVDRTRERRALQQRAVSAYLETAGLNADSRMA